MSGRVAAVSGRGTFDLVRERLGPRVGLVNLAASMLVTMRANVFIGFPLSGALSLTIAAAATIVLLPQGRPAACSRSPPGRRRAPAWR